MATLEQQQQQQATAPVRSNLTLIKDMRPMLKNFECEAIALQQEGEPTTTRDGDTIYRFLVADKTGSIILNIWGVAGQYIKGGDILHISGGSCKIRKGQLIMSTLRSSKIRRIGQDTFPFVEKPNYSEVDYNSISNNRPANNNNSRIPEQDQQNSQQQQQPQQNSTRSHNRGHPYRGGRPPRGGRGGNNGSNKPRYHRDLDNVM